MAGICAALNLPISPVWLWVSIPQQRLYYFQHPQESGQGAPGAGIPLTQPHIYTCSTGRQRPSCVNDSLGTPLGLHRVEARIGAGAPLGAVFRGRVPTGENCFQMDVAASQPNLITTRILRLRGLEPGRNVGTCPRADLRRRLHGHLPEGLGPEVLVDSWQRYIYLHGTNNEGQLGQPASHGCVVLGNRDIATLFEAVPVGSLVYLHAG